jgi:hypothetical protein
VVTGLDVASIKARSAQAWSKLTLRPANGHQVQRGRGRKSSQAFHGHHEERPLWRKARAGMISDKRPSPHVESADEEAFHRVG